MIQLHNISEEIKERSAEEIKSIFLEDIYPVPSEWKEYKTGERFYSSQISELFFTSIEEAEKFIDGKIQESLLSLATIAVDRINSKYFTQANGHLASDSYCVDIQDNKVRIYDGYSVDVLCSTYEEITSWELDQIRVLEMIKKVEA